MGRRTQHNVSVPIRRPVALASLLVVAVSCAHDGPPIATRASSLAPDDHEAVVELAEEMTTEEVVADFDDGDVETLATPTTDPGGDDDDGDDASLSQGLGASSIPMPMPDTVAVIGDSIARSADPYLRPALVALGLEVIGYDAVESRRMVNGGGAVPSGKSAIGDVLASGEEPDLWIIALGTNDVGAATGTDAWASAIDEVMDEIPNDADVMWVDTWLRRLDPEAVQFNATLREELRRHRNTLALDWHDRAATDGLVIEDGVHLSDSGRIEYARMIADAIRATYD